jgi:hypothetical protein
MKNTVHMKDGKSEDLNLIHDILDVFSGKKKSLKEKEPGLVDLMDTVHARERKAAKENRNREENVS